MPECDIRCPIVRAQLKTVVSQAPWIWNEQLASRIEVDETARSDLDRDDQRDQRAAADRVLAKRLIYRDEGKGKGAREVSNSNKSERTKPGSSRRLSDISGAREKADSATQSRQDGNKGAFPQAVDERGVDPSWSRPTVRTAETETATETATATATTTVTEMEMETGTRIKAKKEMSTASQYSGRGTDHDLTKEDESTERSDMTRFEDECEPTCPRRISRKSRIRTLEERQKIVDTYLLYKGTRYFDDVCTCSLSCIVRSLKQDSFVRSIIASVALFTFGLKLCMEFDAWYMPIRLS